MKIFVGRRFIVGATRQQEGPIYIWDSTSGIQKAFCNESAHILAGWPSVSYDEENDTIYADCQNAIQAFDLSILTHLSNLTIEQAARILSYLKGSTGYEKVVYKTNKLLDSSTLRASKPAI